MTPPICIDLFCGLGGWTEGFLAEGYRCIGFDIERHDYGTGGYPGELVLQDALTLDGRQFRSVLFDGGGTGGPVPQVPLLTRFPRIDAAL
jgi:hypothetical protein